MGEISDREKKYPWIRQIQISINDRKEVMRFKIDTRASVTLIEEMPDLSKLIHSKKTFIGPGKTNLKVLGYFIANLSYRKLEIEEKIYVIQNQRVKRIISNGNVETSLSKIRDNYFSKIDANAVFWQIPLEKTS